MQSFAQNVERKSLTSKNSLKIQKKGELRGRCLQPEPVKLNVGNLGDISRTTSFLAFEEKEGRLFTQSSIMQALMLPSREVQWGIDNFAVRLSIDSCCTVWTSRGTQSITDALLHINN